MILILWLAIIWINSPRIHATVGNNPNYKAPIDLYKSHHDQVENAMNLHNHKNLANKQSGGEPNQNQAKLNFGPPTPQATGQRNDHLKTNKISGTTSSKKGKKTQLPQNDQEFADFEDDREGIQGNSELYDYGEDFDCGNETTSSCKPEEYECYSGKCIPRQYVCNTVNDCGDLSDEQGCGCALDQFTCSASQTCIPIQYKCNEFADCPDSSDEDTEMCKGCDAISQFTCNNGHCIELSKLCDDTRDCNDQSDEGPACDIRVCDSHEFSCQNGNCISMALVCNEENNCGDGSDEENCECSITEFKCDNGKCINEEYRCDSADNCRDGSDEFGCDCEAPMYIACRNDERCIASQYQCNNVNDCGDWSDEDDCPCSSDEFACANGHCLDPIDKCDGNNDCGDWTDEEGCSDCTPNELECNNGNCIDPNLVCNGENNCVDGTDEENCGGCIWTQWAGEGMCSEPCGIGKQTFKRKESPWGNKGAADCGSHESKKEECILSGCTPQMADEATEKMEDALKGIDEEISYTMEMIFKEKTIDDDKTTACDEFDNMFTARPTLLKLASGRGKAVQGLCKTHREGGTSGRSLLDRSDLVSDYYDSGKNQGITRVKRRANMGQEMGHAMRQTRVRRRIEELDPVRSRNESKHEDGEQKFQYIVTPRGVNSGIHGLHEDFPEKKQETQRNGEIIRNDATSGGQ